MSTPSLANPCVVVGTRQTQFSAVLVATVHEHQRVHKLPASSSATPWARTHRLSVRQDRILRAKSVACLASETGSRPASEQDTGFRWCSGIAAGSNVQEAVRAACRQATSHLESTLEPQVALVFCSSYYAAEYRQLVPALREQYPSLQHIVGSTGAGVVGNGSEGAREAENEPAVSVALGCLPQVQISSFHVTNDDLPDADASPEQWQALAKVEVDAPGNTSFIVLSNPQFTGILDLLAGLDFAYPNATKIGGLSSAHSMAAPMAVFSWSDRNQSEEEAPGGVLQMGGVVLVLQGAVVLEPIIAQGCQALSERIWAVEKVSHSNLLLELACVSDARPRAACSALRALQMDVDSLPVEARRSVAANLTMAVAPDDFKDTGKLENADFLVRGLLGADQRSGAIAIGETVRLGQRVRFMARGREGAKQDLQDLGTAYQRRRLQASLEGRGGAAPFGALMFTCNGRGKGLYGEPNYDSRTLTSFVPVPVAGFFCNGEIGQVGSATYLHGFTCATAIMRPAPLDERW